MPLSRPPTPVTCEPALPGPDVTWIGFAAMPTWCSPPRSRHRHRIRRLPGRPLPRLSGSRPRCRTRPTVSTLRAGQTWTAMRARATHRTPIVPPMGSLAAGGSRSGVTFPSTAPNPAMPWRRVARAVAVSKVHRPPARYRQPGPAPIWRIGAIRPAMAALCISRVSFVHRMAVSPLAGRRSGVSCPTTRTRTG